MGEQEILRILETTGAFLRDGHFKLVSGNHSDTYVDVRLALQYSDLASSLGKKLADEFQEDKINVVVGFVSGTVLAESVAGRLKARVLLVERRADKIILAKGYIEQGDNVLIVDDVLTTGRSIHKVLRTIRNETTGIVKGVGVIVDRSKKEPDFGVKIRRLVPINMNLWPPKSCPKCKQRIPYKDLSSPDVIYAVAYSLHEGVRTILGTSYPDILKELQEGKRVQPVIVEADKLHIDPTQLEVERLYRFKYLDISMALRKSANGTIHLSQASEQ